MLINHTVQVLVDSVDKTSNLLKDGLYIRHSKDPTSGIAELKFKNFEPADRAEILINVNGETVFGGFVVRKKATLRGTQPIKLWSIEAKDWSELLEGVAVTAEFVETTDSGIIDQLFTEFLPVINTFDHVSTLKADLDVSFANVTLRGVLDQLAERVNASWYIAPNKDLYWFGVQNPPEAGFGFSTTPDQVTTFGFLKDSIEYELDTSTIINQVKIVAGTKQAATKKSESFLGNGSKTSFVLSEIPDSFLFINWNAISNETYTSYGSFVGFRPNDNLINEGGTYNVVVDRDNRIVQFPPTLAPKAATSVTVEYYYKESIDVSVDNINSQDLFGLFPAIIRDQSFGSQEEASQVAQTLLDQNSYGRSSLSFETTKYGLLPGLVIKVFIPDLGLSDEAIGNLILLENGNTLVLENDQKLLQEIAAYSVYFIIQEVSIQPVITPQGFMMVSKVQCGRFVPNLVDSLARISSLTSVQGKVTQQPVTTRLSDISSNMGEIVVGRAVFTDGGTQQFSWSNPGGATGAVIGLEDKDNLYGAVYIYNHGTVMAKLGRMNDVPMIGTIQPTGWGLYTQNGFFSGSVASSYIYGGTVAGNLISGGTVQGVLISGNQITGGTITGGLINASTMIGGTIATSQPPINSSNPGVIMDSTGLYGYGTVGLVFRLSTDPNIRPWFSSGTILNTVYEINTAAVLRTGTTNPRIQIDNSGIFAYDSGGNLRFTVDVSTGRLTASQGLFSGSVTASVITGNLISGGTVTGVAINGNSITGNIISGGTVSGALVSGNLISGGTITATNINGNFITGGTVSSATIVASALNGVLISGGTVQAALVFGNLVMGYQLDVGTAVFVSAYGGILNSPRHMGTIKISEMQFHDTVGNNVISAGIGEVTFPNVKANNIYPPSNNAYAVGQSTLGYTGLYLSDSSGRVWRVSVSTGGFLITT